MSLFNTNHAIRKWTSDEAANVDTGYYLDKYSDIGSAWDQHKQNTGNIHWADYVKANQPLHDAWQSSYGTHGLSRWQWGAQHYEQYGKNEAKRILPFVVGGMQGNNSTDVIHYDPNNAEQAKHDFAAWHYSQGGGKTEGGRWASEMDWYNSPGQVEKREEERRIREQDRAAQQTLYGQMTADKERAYASQAAQAAEAGRLASMRISSSQGQDLSGAATVKGSQTSDPSKPGGTGDFKRPTTGAGSSNNWKDKFRIKLPYMPNPGIGLPQMPRGGLNIGPIRSPGGKPGTSKGLNL